jgi:4-amino-4-deoxy-L-arabinose transferase-like glycosyltransferase
MTTFQHAMRIGLLMTASTLLLGWVVSHTEASFADGLRYIREAEKIQCAHSLDGLLKGIDHPLYPLGIAGVHRVLGGDDPDSWHVSALVLCFVSVVLLVVPLYLLTLELFGDQTAWLACVLVIVNPIIGYILVNTLSECTFLLLWSFGLGGAVRFLREQRLLWLSLAIGFGALAYLTRPEGMLLPAALSATLVTSPLFRATRINWPQWRRAMAFLVGGSLLLVGPYVALKGGIGTKPAIAKVLGLAPSSKPMGLEREKPLAPDQTTSKTYQIAATRTIKVFRAAVTAPLFPLALLGIVSALPLAGRARACLFLAIVLAASAAALVRLHATAGYCTARHGLAPGVILTLAAAYGLTWLVDRVSIPGHWLGLANSRRRPDPAVWAVLFGILVVMLRLRAVGPLSPGPTSVYRETGMWLARNTRNSEQVLDLTNWSLFYSGRPGYVFADFHKAAVDPNTRWIVVREPHVVGPSHYSEVLRDLLVDRKPVALLPQEADLNQLQVCIYDLQPPLPKPRPEAKFAMRTQSGSEYAGKPAGRPQNNGLGRRTQRGWGSSDTH